MVDSLTPERRSWNMSRIRGKDTQPEKKLRSLLHNAGFRFRLHSADMPGRPDIVLRKYSTAIFVNGCYWHRHPGCRKATTPSSRPEFWAAKFEATVARDARKTAELIAAGWRVIVVWECEIEANPDAVLHRIRTEIGGTANGS